MTLLISLVDLVYKVFYWAILLRVLMSWFRPHTYSRGYNQFARLIYQVTEPLLAPVRNFLPIGGMGIDFSPLIVLFLLQILRNSLFRLLFSWRY
ncbi:MAG: YggT family protein [bacterium]|jgi:YggT family protein